MKKYYSQMLLLFLTLITFSHLAAWGGEKDLKNYTNNIKVIVQGIELWSNDHNGHFPTLEEFNSPRFIEYIKKTSFGDPKSKMKDPLSGKPFVYQPFEDRKDYLVKSPNPELYGMEKLYYSRVKGFIAVKLPETEAKPTEKTSCSIKTVEKILESPKESPKPEPVDKKYDVLPDEEKEKITSLIKDLYTAYEQKNLERILEIQKYSIEASAIDYEKKGKGTADEVREAFRDATREIIEHKDFKMKPLNLSDLTFQRKGKYCRVTSIVPVIASERLEIEEEGKFFFVRLRIGEFIFEQDKDIWKIVNMYLY